MIDLPDLPDYGKNQPSFSGTLKGADKQPAPKPEPAPTSPDTPYPGLRPYREDEQNKFFGRDADCRVLIDKILVNRLTLLFAATGVGKSSLLQAAVLPHLKSPHGENLDVVYYNDWISPPLDNLKQAVMRELKYSGSWQQEVVYTPSDPDNEKLGDFWGSARFSPDNR
ncbi:MAG: hypothetical protein HZT40_18060 [Candidatus Thiothrix singaporensis]|uniref:Novel STAND NTPase 1 domain-containing protein n=1 Tax=Candidatus Thiothrix singaporensis TaxID=2799669 RepID=A0A7L6AW43_9GAMM|nr:MAG: hypothetical protein HZT40_18060 [Candidatus Thiothrix singaporensis]